MSRTLIRGGTVVTAVGVSLQDVLIEGERIARVGAPGELDGEHTIDAGGCYVMPGGIDGHVHLENPALGVTRSADDFYTGTVAAACGGTTTIVDFIKKDGEGSLADAFERRRAAAADKAVIDFGFHVVIPPSAAHDRSFDELARLAGDGLTTWKFFMAYPGRYMLDEPTLATGMRLASELGVLPVVHAEDGDMVAAATERLIRAGRTEERYHLDAHEDAAETRAVRRLVALAEELDAPILVFHVSSAEAARELARARERGVPMLAEACPQYLLTAYEDYCGLGHGAAAYICSPPIRRRANQKALWRYLIEGAFDTIGTDHCPFTMGQPPDLPPQKGHGRGHFPRVPNGVPGLEERLMVMWSAGVERGRLSPSRFVELVATGPAKLYGLYPRKGVVAPGADADVVIWDPTATTTIRAAELSGRADYSLYEGDEVRGRPRTVLARGEIVAEDGRSAARRGRGTYLRRGSPALASPSIPTGATERSGSDGLSHRPARR